MMWQTQTTIEYPFALRPASIEEAGLFYAQQIGISQKGVNKRRQKVLDKLRSMMKAK